MLSYYSQFRYYALLLSEIISFYSRVVMRIREVQSTIPMVRLILKNR
jgi:hypothetical protein